MSKISTRSLPESSLFEMPMKFSVNQLPTKTDVYKHYLHSRDNMQSSSEAKNSVREVCKLVLTDLISVWKRAGIPTVTKNSLLKQWTRLTSSCVIKKVKGIWQHFWN